jgi:hypothetical protein
LGEHIVIIRFNIALNLGLSEFVQAEIISVLAGLIAHFTERALDPVVHATGDEEFDRGWGSKFANAAEKHGKRLFHSLPIRRVALVQSIENEDYG